MNKTNTLLLCVTMVVSAQVVAVEGWVDIHTFSIHNHTELDVNGTHYSLNEVNPGIGLTVSAGEQYDNMSYRVGVFRNSYSDTSFYAMLNPHTDNTRRLMFGVNLGLVTGYQNAP